MGYASWRISRALDYVMENNHLWLSEKLKNGTSRTKLQTICFGYSCNTGMSDTGLTISLIFFPLKLASNTGFQDWPWPPLRCEKRKSPAGQTKSNMANTRPSVQLQETKNVSTGPSCGGQQTITGHGWRPNCWSYQYIGEPGIISSLHTGTAWPLSLSSCSIARLDFCDLWEFNQFIHSDGCLPTRWKNFSILKKELWNVMKSMFTYACSSRNGISQGNSNRILLTSGQGFMCSQPP